ncbi:phosphoadenosine phosphosulfate reductase family protein [Parahaliea sp. F7430]|uniref:Phosphoadenosine phosphosulfate reductase family protein n=1 Tax=Sediminihaliea albiluteola TaxID=2758564 RepID=A0A7W2TYD1_9GAMM|nr:phosphoadenosine phosphosulfate reductase family protein [Sediminihaliea albiluteola]MBA6414182.1 phosphoadenosine phosphosulfate reductase family protein [Sediminihaliea albiluteola]
MSIKVTYESAMKIPGARHVLGLSGGKDSAALAIYIKDKYPNLHDKIEYFFTDTGAELKEVYDFLDRLEAYLGKEIVRLSSGKDFDHWLSVYNGFLPSAKQRWCTREMKIKPFEQFVGDDPVVSYIGIRADENREGYISTKETIRAVFPFVEDGVIRDDVFQILEDSVGVPEYYKWRSRSGCYFCFFQRQSEWLGLKRHHPDLFEEAKEYENRKRERYDWDSGWSDAGGYGYTWSSQGTLDELVARAEAREKEQGVIASSTTLRWQEILKQQEDDDPEDQACLICSL